MNLIGLLRHNVSGGGIFPRPSFGPWKDASFKFPLLGTFWMYPKKVDKYGKIADKGKQEGE